MEDPQKILVSDCMRRGVITLKANDSALEAAKKMKRANIGSIVILKDSKAVGIVTERDVAFKIVAAGKNPRAKISEIMSQPLKTVAKGAKIQEAATLMNRYRIRRLGVVDKDRKLIGIITETDLIRVYPGIVDVLVSGKKFERAWEETAMFTGVCDECGLYSEDLKQYGDVLLCEDCADEEDDKGK